MLSAPHNERVSPIRTELFPAFFHQFHCLAGDCRDSCCQGWQIAFSKKDYLTIKRVPKSPELEKLVGHALRRCKESTGKIYAEFSLEGKGACPFFNDRGLCALQLECGEEILPRVCRNFPRLERDTPADHIRGLSTACEAVLQLLWELPEGIDFVMEELPRQQWKRSLDAPRARLFPLLRERCIDILQARSFPLEQRLMILGMALDQVRREGWDLSGVDWSRRVDLLLSDPELSRSLASQPASRALFLTDRLRLSWQLSPYEPFFAKVTQFFLGKNNQNKVTQLSFSQEPYDVAERMMKEMFRDHLPAFWENLLVEMFFCLTYPRMDEPEEVWKSFVSLCNMWALVRFSAVVGYGVEPTRAGMFHGVVTASRATLHNNRRMRELNANLFANNSTDLAHLAVLIYG